MPDGVQLVHSGGECLSDDVDLGSFDTLSECADACVASTTGECSFFIYGECTSLLGCGGNCHRETTSDASCPEGFETDSYSFYSMNRAEPPPPPHNQRHILFQSHLPLSMLSAMFRQFAI